MFTESSVAETIARKAGVMNGYLRWQETESACRRRAVIGKDRKGGLPGQRRQSDLRLLDVRRGISSVIARFMPDVAERNMTRRECGQARQRGVES